jgi:hypothetical protein
MLMFEAGNELLMRFMKRVATSLFSFNTVAGYHIQVFNLKVLFPLPPQLSNLKVRP